MASLRPNRRAAVRFLVALSILALGASAGLLARGGPRQPPPQPTFRTQVNVIQVDAVVLDQQGRFVSDLRQDEVEVLEDGKPQRLASLQVVNVPVERVEAPLFLGTAAVKPDVQTNARPFDGRLYLVVLDDLHTSSMRTNTARRIAKEFIEKNVAANDLAAVVTTSGNRLAAQELTGDRGLLLHAVGQFVGRKVMSPGMTALSRAGTPEAASPEAAGPERIFNARSALQTLTDLTRFAGRIRDRRKAIVYVSEGFDYDFGSPAASMPANEGSEELQPRGPVREEGASREVRDRLREFLGTANRGNVTLYAFDPRVYTHGGDEFVDVASVVPDDNTNVHEQENVRTFKMQDDLLASRDNLRAIANGTGGFAVTGSPQALQAGFDRVRTETSNYYVLGYYPANEARDGKFRKIDVRVTRPGVRVEARKGYTAPKGNAAASPAVDAKEGTSPALRDALGSALPVSGFTLRASAAPFKGAGSNASVLVVVQTRGSDLRFVPKGDKLEDSIELSVVAIDRTGKTRGGERTTIDMPLTPKTQAVVAQTGLVFQMRVDLPPGQYQVRVAGRDAGSQKVGSVHYDLEVPDFANTPLSMSGLVLTAEEAGQVPNPRPDPELQKLLPGSPITSREFTSSDTLTVLAEVYDNKARQPHTLRIAAMVLADDGRTMLAQNEERSTSELQGGRGGFGYTTSIPLRGLAAGLYLVRVEARSTLDPDTVARREMQIRVRSN
jgi:VWFA-related protein